MQSTTLARNVGAYVHGVTVGATSTIDGTEKDGVVIDRLVARDNQLSCKVIIGWEVTLGASETLTIASNIQYDDNSGFSSPTDGDTDDGVLASQIVVTSAGATEIGQIAYDVDMSAGEQFTRVQFTPTVSAAGTGIVYAIMVFGPGNTIPVT